MSNKQKRTAISARKQARREKTEIRRALAEREARQQFLRTAPSRGETVVNPFNLAPNYSRDMPEFLERGTYRAIGFTCKDCGKSEVWTPRQQKWWYEQAKGNLFTTAIRCRNCRRIHRQRRDEDRRIHREGLQRKQAKIKESI